MEGGLFLVLGCVFVGIRSVELKDMRGLGKRMPLTMLAFAIGGLGLIGAPLTAGFISKWYLVLGALEADLWWVAVLILIASLLALVYIFKVIEVAYFQDPPDDWDGTVTEAPLSMLVPTYVLIGASVFFGIHTRPMLSAARQAAEMFLAIGGGQ